MGEKETAASTATERRNLHDAARAAEHSPKLEDDSVDDPGRTANDGKKGLNAINVKLA